MGFLASSVCCIAAICGLAAQPSARIGNVLGMTGVGGGIITTIASMNFTSAVMSQALILMGVGGAVGS